jgi:glycosyltransferase involved in cell wall biosynthesis
VIGEAGLAFGGVDPEKDLADKLNGLIRNSVERERLRKAARERAEKVYSWERVTDRYEEILKELAPGKK